MTMTKAELRLLDGYLASASRYLEFGAGHSTIRAVGMRGLSAIDSVESSPEYVRRVLLNHEAINTAVSDSRLNIHLVDIGEIRGWGFPKNSAKRHLWPNYSSYVFSQPSRHDLVLVDGRFRVACTLRSILHTRPDVRIMIHDFHRRRYHVIQPFLDLVEQTDSLAVFKKSTAADLTKVRALIREYEFRPGDRKTRIANWLDGRWSYLTALKQNVLMADTHD